MARGLRNNNPGNIRISPVRYLGEIVPSGDAAFKQFETMAWGYRAMFVLLYTYQKRHGCTTLRQIIHRYAPPTENNTDGYITRVCRQARLGPDTAVDTADAAAMTAVVAAMSAVENGVPAAADEVLAGWELYVKHRP